MNWWLDKLTGDSTQVNNILTKYRDAMRQLKSEITVPLLKKVAASADKMRSVCVGRDGLANLVTTETLFYIMIYALTGKELKGVVPIGLSVNDFATQSLGRGGEMVATSVQETADCMKENQGQDLTI
jgi:hypothetical protein